MISPPRSLREFPPPSAPPQYLKQASHRRRHAVITNVEGMVLSGEQRNSACRIHPTAITADVATRLHVAKWRQLRTDYVGTDADFAESEGMRIEEKESPKERTHEQVNDCTTRCLDDLGRSGTRR